VNATDKSTTPDSMAALYRPSSFMRAVTQVMVIVFFTSTMAVPAQAMAQAGGLLGAITLGGQSPVDEEEARVTRFFERARERVGRVAGKPDRYGKLPVAIAQEEARESLDDLLEELDDVEESVTAGFESVAELIKSKKMPKTIRKRQDATMAQLSAEFDAVRRDIRQLAKEGDAKKRKTLAEGLYRRLESSRFQRSNQEFDPNDLPNSTLKPDAGHAPRVTENDYLRDGLVGNPLYRVAQAGGYSVAGLPGAGDPAYLAASDEVALSDDIRAKAEELGYQPVRIYEWVRNNVQWQPTWGAIQDASHTLSSRQGNAFDIASLTIALLRASNIPARYVHGTIDVPEAQFRNWAGAFQNLNSAMDFASAGGVPLGPVTSGGRITKVRMEHVWVEAAIDFQPSHGVRNREADSWVALDPSFKQVQLQSGLELRQLTGVDPEALATDTQNSGTVNDAEGWVAGLNPAIVQNAQNQALGGIRNRITEMFPTATMGDVFGGRRIVTAQVSSLPTSLPNKIVQAGARYASLPAALQQQITFAFGKDVTGEPISPRTFSWSTLNNRRITLSFRPASADDQAALQSLYPVAQMTDVSQIPTSIPAYLINVVPELKVEDTVVMTGPAMTLGTDLTFVFNPRFAGRGTKAFNYKLPAGSYLAVAVAGGSVSGRAIDASRARLTATQAILTSGDTAAMNRLTRDDVIGEMFQLGLLSYYAQYSALGYLGGLSSGGHHQLAAGLGSFGLEPDVKYFFGIPRTLRSGGGAMNIPIVNIVGHEENTAEARRGYTIQLGVLSSTLEHEVPEQMFDTPTSARPAISAVKALSDAQAAGQRIYRVDASNQNVALPQIHHNAATMDEIRAAIAAGKVVITHTQAVGIPGWSGAGYILMDPDTGEAAWKIGGGANGSRVLDFFAEQGGNISLALMVIGFIAFFMSGPFAIILGWLLLATAVLNTIIGTMLADLKLREAGCPEGLSQLLYAVTLVAFFLPKFLKDKVTAMALGFYSMIMKGAIGGVTTVCPGN
jgi:transglutaminase-like putative cysteine protease